MQQRTRSLQGHQQVEPAARTIMAFPAHQKRSALHSDGAVLTMSLGPLPAVLARRLLASEPLAGLPVKAALLPRGLQPSRRGSRSHGDSPDPFLLAEMPPGLARDARARLLEESLDDALDIARRLAADSCNRPSEAQANRADRGREGETQGAGNAAPERAGTKGLAGEVEDAGLRSQVEAGLASLGWPWRAAPNDAAAYLVTANDVGDARQGKRPASWMRPPLRIEVLPLSSGARRIVARGAVAFGAPHCVRAIERFALRTNGRLRLARIGVSAGGAALVRVAWEAFLLPELPPETSISHLVRAVAAARDETAESLSALGDPHVAREFLNLGW